MEAKETLRGTITRPLSLLVRSTISFAFIAWSAMVFAKYLQYPTYFSTEQVDQTQIRFPTVTICPISPRFKSDVLKVDVKGSTSCTHNLPPTGSRH